MTDDERDPQDEPSTSGETRDDVAEDAAPGPAEDAEETPRERVVRGRLISPGQTPESPPPQALGPSHYPEDDPAHDGPPAEDLRSVQGSPTWFAIGMALFVLGLLVYLYGLYATANAVLVGASDPEQRISLFGMRWLIGSIGLGLTALGAILAVVFLFLPMRAEPVATAGSLQYRVLMENARSAYKLDRVLAWGGLGLLLVGLLLVIGVFQATVDQGRLWTLSLGGARYRIHFLGYLMVAVGLVLFLTMAPRLRPLRWALQIADAHTHSTHGRGGVAPGHQADLESEEGLPRTSTQSVPDPDDHGVSGLHVGWR